MLGGAVVPRRKEQSVAAADDRGAVDREAESRARRHFDCRRITLLRRGAVDTGEDQAAGQGAAREQPGLGNQRVQRADRFLVEPDGLPVVDLLQAVFMFESNAIIDRQPLTHPPIILNVRAVVGGKPITLATVEGYGSRCRHAEQDARQFMAADAGVAREQAIEEELSAHFTFRRQLDAQLPQVAADLDAVAAEQFGQRAVDRVGLYQRTGPPPHPPTS